MQAAGLSSELKFDERIYEASARTLLEVVSQIEDAAKTVMLVGHNPGFEDLCEALTDQDRHLPTASIARVELHIEQWKEAQAGVGQLQWFMTPKKLKGAQ